MSSNEAQVILDHLASFRYECEQARLQEARKPVKGVGVAARRRAAKHAGKLLKLAGIEVEPSQLEGIAGLDSD